MRWYKGGSREASQEVTAGIQVNYEGWDQGGGSRGHERLNQCWPKDWMWSVSGRGVEVNSKVTHTQLCALTSVPKKPSSLSPLE